MKAKLTIILDLPEKLSTATDSELRTVIYDEFMRTVHIAHKEAVLELMSITPDGPNVKEILKAGYEHHLEWMGITDVPEWWIERIQN